MRSLDEVLKVAHPARLIPTVADSRKEERLVSILLATLPGYVPLRSNCWTAAERDWESPPYLQAILKWSSRLLTESARIDLMVCCALQRARFAGPQYWKRK